MAVLGIIRQKYLGWLLLPLLMLPVRAESLQLHEEEIKVGLLYNFLKYTEWPALSAQEMTICLWGGNPFGKYLEPLQTRTVQQRPIVAKHVSKTTELENCQLLFISTDKARDLPAIVGTLKGKPVLTVSDIPNFNASGGMIEFSMRDNRINVILNLEAVQATGLRVQPRLLNLVTVMEKKP